MTLREAITDIAANIPVEALEFKSYGKNGRLMATSRTVNVQVPNAAVPGHPDKRARMQVTFCVNFLDIDGAEKYTAKAENRAEQAVESLTPEQRNALLEKYLK
jgi:hypothetical protein